MSNVTEVTKSPQRFLDAWSSDMYASLLTLYDSPSLAENHKQSS